MKTSTRRLLAHLATTAGLLITAPVLAKNVSACLITKTDTNPYFVTMKKGAMEKAKALGVQLKTYAGKYDGDNQAQVDAIESCMADHADGILITPSDTRAIVPTVQKARQAVLLRAVYGANPLKEQMVWFWLNHFSVYAPKARVRWTLVDYEQRVIRPHALGKFRDLVLATLKSPAMLEYLDNAQNARVISTRTTRAS